MTDDVFGLIHATAEKLLTGTAGGDDLWARIEDSGIPRAGLAEEKGGAGLALPRIMALVRLAGAHACPFPLAETLTAGWIAENLADAPDMQTATDFLTQAGGAADPDLRALGALMRANQMVGAMRRAIGMAVDHANLRHQFGRPIGRFQAVQHMLALAAEQAVASEVIAKAAAHGHAGPNGDLLIAAAKHWASRAVRIVNDAVHQTHGAMGLTEEYRLHHFTRRLWTWRDEFGSEYEWQRYLGERAVRAGGAGLWALIAGEAT